MTDRDDLLDEIRDVVADAWAHDGWERDELRMIATSAASQRHVRLTEAEVQDIVGGVARVVAF